MGTERLDVFSIVVYDGLLSLDPFKGKSRDSWGRECLILANKLNRFTQLFTAHNIVSTSKQLAEAEETEPVEPRRSRDRVSAR